MNGLQAISREARQQLLADLNKTVAELNVLDPQIEALEARRAELLEQYCFLRRAADHWGMPLVQCLNVFEEVQQP